MGKIFSHSIIHILIILVVYFAAKSSYNLRWSYFSIPVSDTQVAAVLLGRSLPMPVSPRVFPMLSSSSFRIPGFCIKVFRLLWIDFFSAGWELQFCPFLLIWISSFKAPSMKAAFSQCRLLTLSSKVSDIKNIFKYYPGGFSSVSQNYCAGHILWFLFHCKALPCVAHFLGRCDKCQCEQKSIYPTCGNRDPTKVGCAESEFIGVICRGMGEGCLHWYMRPVALQVWLSVVSTHPNWRLGGPRTIYRQS